MQKEAIDLIRQCRGVNRESTSASVAAAIRKEIDALTKNIREIRSQDSKRKFASDRAYWKAILPYVEAMA